MKYTKIDDKIYKIIGPEVLIEEIEHHKELLLKQIETLDDEIEEINSLNEEIKEKKP